MKGTILGIRELDFVGQDDRAVKKTQYWVGFKARGTEGQQAEKITWDVGFEKAEAPILSIGEVVEVERSAKGRLQFSEEEE